MIDFHAAVTAATPHAPEASNLLVGIGGPVSAALIIALGTWIIRLLSARRKLEQTAHAELVKTVDELAQAVRDITTALGGSPATAFEPKRVGIVDAVSALAATVATLDATVTAHGRKIATLERKPGRPA